MQIGMRLHDLGKADFLSQIQKMKDLDIHFTQLAFHKAIDDIDFTTGNFSEGLCHYLSSNFKNNDINIPILGCYIDPNETQRDKIEAQMAKFKEHLKYAKYLNASMVGTETGHIYDYSDSYIEKNYQCFLSNMKILRDYAEKLGVFFAVEGVTKDTLHNSKLMKRFFEDIDSPNALAIYDPVNLIFADESSHLEIAKNIDDCFEDYGDKISIIHIKDFKVEKDDQGKKIKKKADVGQGLMDFERLFFHLNKKKPHITMLVEDSRYEQYPKDVEFLNKFIKK